ncbi:MAG: leucine-rich repeat protein [Firmicutes bacterium]|nr:leucine-rich repeat protein [Bacillota bacterium]
MKYKKKCAKIVSSLLAALMLCTNAVYAENTVTFSNVIDSGYIDENTIISDGIIYRTAGDEAGVIGYTDGLENIVIPSTVGDKKVTSVVMLMPYDAANNYMLFDDEGKVKTLVFSEGIEKINLAVPFYGVTSITLPDTLKEFHGNSLPLLEKLDLPSGLETFGGVTDLQKLKSVTFPEGLKKLNTSTFVNCPSLEEVSLPSTLESIYKGSFMGCDALKRINVAADSPFFLEKDGSVYTKDMTTLAAAVHPDGDTFVIPKEVTEISAMNMLNCHDLKNIEVEAGNSVFTAKDGALYRSGGKDLVRYAGSAAEFTVPDSVTKISEYAFGYEKALENAVIPNSVTSIENGCFYRCKALKKAKLPDGLETLPDLTFSLCVSLEEVSIPETVTYIGMCFEECHALKELVIPKSVKTVYMPIASCNELRRIIVCGDTEVYFKLATGCPKLELVEFMGREPVFFWNSAPVYAYKTAAQKDDISAWSGLLEKSSENLEIHYIKGTDGWTTPIWNGYKCYPVDNIELPKKEDAELAFSIGNADGEGVVTASDAVFVLQKTLVSTFELPIQKKTDDWMKYVDVDCDNKITAGDAAFILQKTLSSTFELPAEKKYK